MAAHHHQWLIKCLKRKRKKTENKTNISQNNRTYYMMTPSDASADNRPIAVFVIAHPDDESMFFVPTICALKANDQTCCWILCLSNGNYDGLGKEREIELHRVGRGYLNVNRVIIVNHEGLQDSPTARWSKEAICQVLNEHLPSGEQPCDIYTFDQGGVSGHINHVDTHLGVQHYLRQQQEGSTSKTISVFQLVTVTNILQKYLPILQWIVFLFTLLVGRQPNSTSAATTATSKNEYTMYQPWINWKCMAGHASQFVWYRRLFVVFSCYTYVNKWKLMER
jgi:N-acetylglucosaminylphosphatidylinositol deacetylase